MTDINLAATVGAASVRSNPGDVVTVNEGVSIDSPNPQSAMLARMRLELGDPGRSFNSTAFGDGSIVQFDLPVGLVDPASLKVSILHQDQTTTPIGSPAYILDINEGLLTFSTPPSATDTVLISGYSYSLFTNLELQTFLDEAMLQHNHNRTIVSRTLGPQGFIAYNYSAVNYDNLPEVERYPVVLLATIEALWTLSTDASSDIDITTADGTTVPRSRRYEQIMSQITQLQARYDFFREQLNVGLGRVEISNLRRVSRTTNRLIPLYVDREYDDHTYPKRILPPIDAAYADPNAGQYPDFGYWGGNF